MRVEQVGTWSLPRYAAIPIVFAVESVFRVCAVEGGLGGFRLAEERVSPYQKDYDSVGEVGERVLDWPLRWDMTKWGVFLAVEGEQDVGGAAVAVDTPGMEMLEGRSDLAVLWDIRVRPDRRRRGVGSALFAHAAAWARGRGLRHMKIETQNTNVPACRFYASQGCELGTIHRFGYAGRPGVENEAVLFWYLDV